MANNVALFLGEMVRRPGQVVALAPSSASTARLMVQGLEKTKGPIVEIGPGTGSFTKAILETGVAPERLTLLEMNERFCETLRQRFPGVRVLNQPAQEIEQIGLQDVSAVISGIAIISRPNLQRDIVGRSLNVLAKDGFFTQFTYSTKSPISEKMQAELGLKVEKLGTAWVNLPPARVFRYMRSIH